MHRDGKKIERKNRKLERASKIRDRRETKEKTPFRIGEGHEQNPKSS